MSHKLTALITVATSGIGFATARFFIDNQDQLNIGQLILHGRSIESIAKASDLLITETQCSPSFIVQVFGDFELRTQVEDLVSQIIKTNLRIDILINNAAVYKNFDQLGEYNVHQVINVNHLHVLYLTLNLLPKCISPEARIVFVASTLYKRVPDASHDLALESNRCMTKPSRSYPLSKLYNIWTCIQLARLMSKIDIVGQSLPNGVIVTSVCPGFIPTTNLIRHASKWTKPILTHVFPLLPFTTSLPNGVQRLVYASFTDDRGIHGKLIAGNPITVQQDVMPHALDLDRIRLFWDRSVAILNLQDHWKLGGL